MRINPKLSKVIASFCSGFILNKNKRKTVRQNINLYFGNVSHNLAHFVDIVQSKQTGLINGSENIDVLIIGDSHAELGVLPFLISENSFNFAFSGNGLYEMYRTLQIATETCKNIKKIILLVSFWQCGYSEIHGSGSKWCQVLDKILGISYDYSLNANHDYVSISKALDILLSSKGIEKERKKERKSILSGI